MELSDEIERVISCLHYTLTSLSETKFEEEPTDLLPTIQVLSTIKLRVMELSQCSNRSEMNPVTCQRLISCLLYNLEKFGQLVELWGTKFRNKDKDSLSTYKAKFETISEFVEVAPFLDKNDLFCLGRSEERWLKLRENCEYVSCPKPQKVRRKYENFVMQVAAGQAIVSVAHSETKNYKKRIIMGLGAIYYNLFRKKAKRKAEASYARAQIEVAQSLWNLVDSWILTNFMKILIPKINTNKVIYLPRTAPHLLDNSPPKDTETSFKSTKTEDSVMVRLLSTSALEVDQSSLLKCCLPVKDNQHDQLIFHIHGGGFISMSSASHQVYTRRWVNNLGIPLLSVDYRLAPAHPFPEPLDDIWQAYYWAINNAEQLGITPKKVVIVGDSAGGNLALALAYKAIQAEVKVPDGIVVAYPALNLSKNNFTDSLLLTLDDLLLPHTLLKLCLKSYIQDPALDPSTNPLLSPLVIEEHMLEKFPPVRMLVGSADPLHDDCWRFLERLVNCGVDAKMKVYEAAMHACLNLCFKGGIKESQVPVDQMGDWISELLSN